MRGPGFSFLLFFSSTMFISSSMALGDADVDAILDRVMAELSDESGQISFGGCPMGQKSTDFSRAMALRNMLFQRTADELLSDRNHEGNLTEVEELINAGLSRLTIDRAGRAIDQVNDACNANIKPTCDPTSKFRTIGGQCNNLQNPYWGALNIAQRRFVGARYADGAGEPFGRSTSNTCTAPAGANLPCPRTNPASLPSPRLVSHAFHTDMDRPSSQFALILMQFAQFLDHDITLTPNGGGVPCCATGINNGPSGIAECFTITVPPADSFVALNGASCLDFTRSTSFCQSLTTVREQMNVITAFVDASNVYGSDDSIASMLRSNTGGLLATSLSSSNKVLLPIIAGFPTGGDKRAVEHPSLTTMHTLFLRENNRIANYIASKRPAWDDQTIFSNARALVGAQMQNIVYGQFLPIILGQATVDSLGLSIANGTSTYDATVDPSIRNEFSTAAYRFGHTLIQGLFNVRNLQTGVVEQSFPLKDNFFETPQYFGTDGNGAEKIIYGILDESAQSFDRFITLAVTNFLVPDDPGLPRSDLVSRNLQRSRDHGLASYNEVRQFCGLTPSCSWDVIPAEIDPDRWARLSQIYSDPNDIELFVGGLAEESYNGGLLGRTFNCVVSKQFKMIKDGDRFFFTHAGQVVQYSPAQLANIRSRNLGDIICDNTDIPTTSANVFIKGGAQRPCAQNNKLNIDLFVS